MARRERIVVAMSGGVDSSVAAARLVAAGHEVIGCALQTWGQDACGVERAHSCCSLQDVEDARLVARRLGIPFYVLDVHETFARRVVDYFTEAYLTGTTPNPCIACNNEIKYGTLLQRADALGADAVATGHYARVSLDRDTGRWQLWRGMDERKDQSYVLFGLRQEQLARTRFPVGGFVKADVRAQARALELPVHDKPDSQEICFIPDGQVRRFLEGRAGDRLAAGEIVDRQGRVVGVHHGAAGFTVGQRRGLGLTASRPLYVVAVDPVRNRVVVGEAEALEQRAMVVRGVNWVGLPGLEAARAMLVQVRAHQAPVGALVAPEGPDQVRVEFETPQRALTPGQAAVFYEGGCVLGGGWIARAQEPRPGVSGSPAGADPCPPAAAPSGPVGGS